MLKPGKLLLAICTLSLIAACNEGEYNDLSCDSTTYVPKCMDGIHLMKCDKDTLVVVTCSALDYCGENASGVADCLPTYPNYNPSAIPSDTTPPVTDYLCTPEAVRCSNDYIQTCNGYAWINAETPCEFGCKDGVCRTEPEPPGPVDSIAECTNDTECRNGFSCNAGSCVSTDMLEAKVGDPCEEEWFADGYYEICQEDGTIRFCGYNEDGEIELVEEQCTDGCTKVFLEAGMFYDIGIYSAICKSDICKPGDEELTYCSTDSMMGASLHHAHCLPTTSGDLTPFITEEDEDKEISCMNECNADNTDCDLYGYTGNSCDEYTGKCDENNVYWYCIDFGIGIAQGVMECSKSDSICDAVNGEYGCWEPCTEIGDIKQECENDPDWGDHILWTGTCTDFGNGQIYYSYVYEECANLCDEEKLECVVLEPGDTCDSHSNFTPECSGNSTTDCVNDTVVLDQDCSQYGADYKCSTVQAAGDCREKCVVENETKTGCFFDSEWGEADLYIYQCMADDSGELVWVAVDANPCSSNQCLDETSCVKLVDNEGEPCPADMEESCSGDVVVYCDEGIVTALNCEDYETRCGVATIDGTPISDCYEESQRCDTLGEKMQQCVDSWFFSYEIFYECMDIDIGRYFAATEAYYCDDQCNADATACQ